MKRVAINALVLHEGSGGLGVYIQKLVEYLTCNKLDFEPVIFLSKQYYEKNPDFATNPYIYVLNISPYEPSKRIVREAFIWPELLKKEKINLFFSPMSYVPLGVRIPTMLTIHDLRCFHFKDFYSIMRREFLKTMFRRSAERAGKIIAVSHFTARDIIETLGINPDKIKVIHEGLDKTEFGREYSIQELGEIKNKYKLPEKYLLSIGRPGPRKNFLRLIEAFYKLKSTYNIEHKLVIVGYDKINNLVLSEFVQKLDLTRSVIFIDFVDSEHLPAIYQLADIYITPSIFEGFGFTPLESMAAGRPVIASNVTSLPEVVENAALLLDPFSVEDISQKIYALLTDPGLQNNLIKKGYTNIQRFDWEKCLSQTVEEINKMLNLE